MAVTAFPSMEQSPDLTLLNVARLFTRLEHNLLSPGTELRTLRKSELQRMRVAKVYLCLTFPRSLQWLELRSWLYICQRSPAPATQLSLGPHLTSSP